MKPNKAVAVQVAVSPMEAYAGVLASVQTILDAKALEDDKSLPDGIAVRNAVFSSLSLFIRGNGITPDAKLSKEDKVELRKSHDAFRSAVRSVEAITLTVHGQAAVVHRLGKCKLIGQDAYGLPTHRRQSGEWDSSLTPAELAEIASNRSARNSEAAKHYAALATPKA